jgi:hypothetical protein
VAGQGGGAAGGARARGRAIRRLLYRGVCRERARVPEAAAAMAASADGPWRALLAGPARARAGWTEPRARPNPVDRFFSFF